MYLYPTLEIRNLNNIVDIVDDDYSYSCLFINFLRTTKYEHFENT